MNSDVFRLTRKIGFGLRPEEDPPDGVVDWAIGQLDGPAPAVGVAKIPLPGMGQSMDRPSVQPWPQEAQSKDAVHLFDQIDFLHLDGAHSVVNSAEDVVLYLRKLRKGGIIALDDIDWKTNMPAYEIAKSICTTEAILRNEETGRESCAILRKI